MRSVFIWLATFGCGIIVGVWCCVAMPQCPELKATLELNAPNQARFLANRLNTLVWTSSDGTVIRYRVGDPSNPNCNLTLNGSEPLVIPDDHGQTTLRAMDIRGNKATIVYLSQFDLSSFGDNVVTIDSGAVELEVVKLGP